MRKTTDRDEASQTNNVRAAQEAQLRQDPTLRRFAESRQRTGRRPVPAALSLRQPGGRLERPERALLLAGAVAPLLPGLSAGESAAALGARGQRRPDPLARPAVRDRARPRGSLLVGLDAGRGRPRDRHVPRSRARQHGGRGERSAAAGLGESDGHHGHSQSVPDLDADHGRRADARRGRQSGSRGRDQLRLRPVHLEKGRILLFDLRRNPAARPQRPAHPGAVPLPLARSGDLGVSASLCGRRYLWPGGRRRRLPVLLADRRPAHPAALQPHERRALPAGRLRHRPRQVRGHLRRALHLRPVVSWRRARAHGDPRRPGRPDRALQHQRGQAHARLEPDHEPAAAPDPGRQG